MLDLQIADKANKTGWTLVLLLLALSKETLKRLQSSVLQALTFGH
jgi:hypothetical protein